MLKVCGDMTESQSLPESPDPNSQTSQAAHVTPLEHYEGPLYHCVRTQHLGLKAKPTEGPKLNAFASVCVCAAIMGGHGGR